MPIEYKERTVFYKRANWATNGNILESHINEFLNANHGTNNKTFTYSEGSVQCAGYNQSSEGTFLHLAYYVEGQNTSTVDKPSDNDSSEIETIEPPCDKEFMEGDLFAMVKGNHVILCQSGLRDTALDHFFQFLLRIQGLDALSAQLSCDNIANLNTLNILRNEGVKRVSLDASLYEATCDYTERNTVKKSILGNMADTFISMFQEDETLREISESENLSVKLELSFDKRRKGGELGKKRISELSKRLLNESNDGGLLIETLEGKKINSQEIKINKPYRIESLGKSVKRLKAWDALLDYYSTLRDDGILEQ